MTPFRYKIRHLEGKDDKRLHMYEKKTFGYFVFMNQKNKKIRIED